MKCEKCGSRFTAVVDSRTDDDLEGRRIRSVVWALGTNVMARLKRTKSRLDKDGVRLRLRRCADCGNEQATVELTAAQLEKF